MSGARTLVLGLFVATLACAKPATQSVAVDGAASPGATPAATASQGTSVEATLRCVTPPQSQDLAKPRVDADPPYAECAAGIFAHCEPGGSYCSIALNVVATARTRKTDPGVCCYGSDRRSP